MIKSSLHLIYSWAPSTGIIQGLKGLNDLVLRKSHIHGENDHKSGI